MLIDRVETFKAYRDTLRRRFDQATHAALEEVPSGGEWDGMQVVRRKELERIIADFAAADPEPLPTSSEVRTPARVFVDAVCPICAIPARVMVEIHAELVVDEDGRTIKAKASTKGSSHVCGQLPLEAGEDVDQMSLSDLAEPSLVLARDVSKPDDVSLETPEEERCGATAELPSEDPSDPAPIELVCERKVDHDALGDDAGRDHWSEGGFAWSYRGTFAQADTFELAGPDEPTTDAENDGEENDA